MAGIRMGIDAEAVANLAIALANASDGWAEDRRERFNAEWAAMQALGCEMIEMDGLTARPSPDILAHMRAYGVDI